MPSAASWTSGALPNWFEDTTDKAYFTAARIAEQSISITVRRLNATLSAQAVRIDAAVNNPNDRVDANNRDAAMRVVITGYKNHPTITATDLQMGDQFTYDGLNYDVIQVLPNTVGSLQAIAEASRS